MKKARLLPFLLAGYLFLLIFRPYEYWTMLGEFHVERVYMIFFLAVVFFSKEKHFVPSSINGAILLFSAVLLLSSFFSISWNESWKIIDDYLKYVVFYFLVILCVHKEEDLLFIILAFIMVMLLYVGKSSWEFFVNGRHVYRMGITRMIGIDASYGDPNSFAASICYSLPLTWALIRARFDAKWIIYMLYLYFFLAIVAIIMTGSRSGMVTLILFFGMIYLTTSRKFLTCVVLIFIVSMSWQFMNEDLQTRFLSTFIHDIGPQTAQGSAESRYTLFLHGLKLFKNNPVLGVGPNAFPLTTETGLNAHNLFGQLLGETGFVGGVVFFSIIFLLIHKNIMIVKKINQIIILQNRDGNKMLPPNYSISISKNNKVNANISDKIYSSNYAFNFSCSDNSRVFLFVAVAIIQTLILMIFKGWGDHNLYRYTWLWLGSLTVLNIKFVTDKYNILNIK